MGMTQRLGKHWREGTRARPNPGRWRSYRRWTLANKRERDDFLQGSSCLPAEEFRDAPSILCLSLAFSF